MNKEMDPEADSMEPATARKIANQKIVVGIHCGKNGNYEKSKEYFDEALQVLEAASEASGTLEEFADSKGQVYENLGMLFYSQGNLEESEIMLKESLNMYALALHDDTERDKSYIQRNANDVETALLEIQEAKEMGTMSTENEDYPPLGSSGENIEQWPAVRSNSADSPVPANVSFFQEAALLDGEGKAGESIQDIFDKFDVNGDHVLQLDEFTAYLVHVFEQLQKKNPSSFRGHTPLTLARETASKCFAEADSNNDGSLSFFEFKEWLQPKTTVASPKMATRDNSSSVAEIDNATNWRFAAATDAARAAAAADKESQARKVKMKEANGLGVNVNAGTIDEGAARLVFDKYDTNGDGVFDLAEFTEYLTSVFTALMPHNKAAFRLRALSPRDMAKATAEQCFREADRNHDGSLSFEEFKMWYKSSSGGESLFSKQASDVDNWRTKAAATAAAAAEAASSAMEFKEDTEEDGPEAVIVAGAGTAAVNGRYFEESAESKPVTVRSSVPHLHHDVRGIVFERLFRSTNGHCLVFTKGATQLSGRRQSEISGSSDYAQEGWYIVSERYDRGKDFYSIKYYNDEANCGPAVLPTSEWKCNGAPASLNNSSVRFEVAFGIRPLPRASFISASESA